MSNKISIMFQEGVSHPSSSNTLDCNIIRKNRTVLHFFSFNFPLDWTVLYKALSYNRPKGELSSCQTFAYPLLNEITTAKKNRTVTL